jgi:hypothetical protein
LLALLVLAAVFLGASAAGTPVNGDPSIAATTAGINLGHTVQVAPRLEAPPPAGLFDLQLLRLLLGLAGWVVLVLVAEPRERLLLWWEWRGERAPPLLQRA